jgi:hypothetical protein
LIYSLADETNVSIDLVIIIRTIHHANCCLSGESGNLKYFHWHLCLR